MKILKIVLISIWVLLIFGLAMYIQTSKIFIKQNGKVIGNKIYLMQSPAEMSAEYYRNFSYLKTKSDFKHIADSIFKNSDFLKTYERIYLKHNKNK